MMVAKGRQAAKGLLSRLRQGGHAGILVDQKQNDGVPVPLFGREAMTGTLAADLAQRFAAPIVPIKVTRLEGARFRIEAFAPLELPAERLAALTALNALIERWVRETPGQWLWQHRRWPE
jgi:KDO2-lipid IV(A) lauroyltransferase